MKAVRRKSVLILIFILLLIPVVSASLTLSKPETIYNAGDPFMLSIKVSPAIDQSGFLTAELICNDKKIEIYKSPHSVKANEEKVVDISTDLGSFLISGFEGSCYVLASFPGEESASKNFDLTKKISVSVNVNGILFNPGETISIYGRADKVKGALEGGTAEIHIYDMFSLSTYKIVNGEYSANITIPKDTPAGDYNIVVKVSERDAKGELLNEGTASSLIKVRQVLSSLEIALDSQSVTPGKELTYKVLARDQADNIILSDVPVLIFMPDGTEMAQKLLRTEETVKQMFEKNASPGRWTIKASLEELEVTKEILVEDLSELSYTLNPDQTLAITNIGNIPYSGQVEISIGATSKVKEITELPVGESHTFRLAAPDGEYPVIAGTGESRKELGTTFLTGNAISVDELGLSLKENMLILVWIIVILILVIIGLMIYRRVSKKGFIGKVPPQVQVKKELLRESKNLDVEKVPMSHIIDRGEKQEELKNSREALQTIDSALWKAKESRAKIYSEGDHRIVVFAPVLTKEKDNAAKALTTAQTIERILIGYNKRHEPRIDFGIGVHVGNLIVETKDGRFKFISLSSTISSAKKLAQHSNNDVLVSEQMHRQTISMAKTQKLPDQNYWKLLKVTDRSQHTDYIQKFTEQQKRNAAKASGRRLHDVQRQKL